MSYPGDGIKQEYKEDILVGYRWYDTKKIPTTFAFGHGLSYTSFEYGKAVASAKKMTLDGQLELTVSVKNVGDVAGKEVVQLYIGDEEAYLDRPVKELKGFKKVHLEPGETKTVEFVIEPDMLKFFDDAKHEWVLEKGKFTAYVGSSSQDIRSEVSFEVK